MLLNVNDGNFSGFVRSVKRLRPQVDQTSGNFDYEGFLHFYGYDSVPEKLAAYLKNEALIGIFVASRLLMAIKKFDPVLDFVSYYNKSYGNGFSSREVNCATSINNFLKICAADVNNGIIDRTIQRTLTLLGMMIFTHTFADYGRNKRLKTTSYIFIVDLCCEKVSDRDKVSWVDFSKIIKFAIDIFLIIDDKYAIEKIISYGEFSKNTEIIESLIREKIRSCDIEGAKKHLKIIELHDRFSPRIDYYRGEIEREENIRRLRSVMGINFNEIESLSGVDFEDVVIGKFTEFGFSASGTPRSGDFGADVVVVTENGTRIVVQCKRYKAKLNLKAVQEVVAAMAHYSADFGIVITTNGFLSSAVQLSKSSDVELWGRDEVIKFLSGNLSFSVITDL